MKRCLEPILSRLTFVLAVVTLGFALNGPAHAQGELPEACRAGVSFEEILRSAHARAVLIGLMPPEGEPEARVSRLEALTAEEHDLLYPDIPIVGHVPVVEAWECVWRVELSGSGKWCGSRFPSTCSPMYQVDVALSGDAKSVWYESIHLVEVQDQNGELPETCRGGISGEEVANKARNWAAFNGLRPAGRLPEVSISKLEALTAEQHDELYPEVRQRGPGISPQPPADHCIWRAEVEGVGWFFGGRAGFYGFTRKMDFGIDGPSGDLRYDVIRFAYDPWRVWLPIGARGR